MARITVSEVRIIITTAKSDGDVSTIIDIANRYTTDKLGSKGLSSARLKDIELYLSAHLIAVTTQKGGIKSERIGDSQRTYSILSGSGLQGSPYGQTAILLDISGCLISADKKVGMFRALGV